MARVGFGGPVIGSEEFPVPGSSQWNVLSGNATQMPRNSKDFTGMGFALRSFTNPSIDLHFEKGDGDTTRNLPAARFRGWFRIRRYPVVNIGLLASHNNQQAADAAVVILGTNGVLSLYNDGAQPGFGDFLGATANPIPLMTWTKAELYVKQNTAPQVGVDPPYEANGACAFRINGKTVFNAQELDTTSLIPVPSGAGGTHEGLQVVPFATVTNFRLGTAFGAGPTASDIDWSHIAIDDTVFPDEPPPVSFVAAGALATDVASDTLSLVAPSCETNDVLFAYIHGNNNQAVTRPAGWTLVKAINNTSAMRSSIFWHRATSADSGATFDFTKPTNDGLLFAGLIVAWRDCRRTGSPIDGSIPTSSVNASSDTLTYPSLDPIAFDAMVVAAGFYGENATTPGAISGTDPDLVNNVDVETSDGAGCSIFVDAGVSSGAATGIRTRATASTTDSINTGIVFGILPHAQDETRVTLVPVLELGTYQNWIGGQPDARARRIYQHPTAVLVGLFRVTTTDLGVRQSYLCQSLAAAGITGTITGAKVMAFMPSQGGAPAGLRLFVRRNGIDTDGAAFLGPTGFNAWTSWLFDVAGWLPTDEIEIGVLSRSNAGTSGLIGLALLIEHDSPAIEEPIGDDDILVQLDSWTGTAAPQSITLPFKPHFIMWQPRSGSAPTGGGMWWNTQRTGHVFDSQGLVKLGVQVRGRFIDFVDGDPNYNATGVIYDCLCVRDPKNRIHARGSFAQTAETTPVSTDDWDVDIGEGSGTNDVISFTPEALIAYRESEIALSIPYVRGPGHVGDLASQVAEPGVPIANRIQALQTDGFQAGSGFFDGNAQHFPFLGLRTTAFFYHRLFDTVAATGDGTASQVVAVNLGGGVPIWAWVIAHNGGGGQWIRHTYSTATIRSLLGDTSTTKITALGPNSVTLGADLNELGVTYTLLVWGYGTDRGSQLVGPLAWVEWPRFHVSDAALPAAGGPGAAPAPVDPMTLAWVEFPSLSQAIAEPTPDAVVEVPPATVDPMTLAWVEWPRNVP